MSAEADHIIKSVTNSVNHAHLSTDPYLHFTLEDFFPADVARGLLDLPFLTYDLNGISGKRELHNESRSYFDRPNMAKLPVFNAVAEALQSPTLIALFEDKFGAQLDDTYLRLEYAQDIDGFWLEPHTDLGVKKFTCLIYLSEGEGHDDLGTDIFRSRDEHFGRPPFIHNHALIFIPADNTWHGFLKRPIKGVRKSIILNYVTSEWRAREQLSYPDKMVSRHG